MGGWVLVNEEDIRSIKHSKLPPLPSLNKYGTTHTHINLITALLCVYNSIVWKQSTRIN